eukprot:c41383_g1_i1 orf=80-319(+)
MFRFLEKKHAKDTIPKRSRRRSDPSNSAPQHITTNSIKSSSEQAKAHLFRAMLKLPTSTQPPFKSANQHRRPLPSTPKS